MSKRDKSDSIVIEYPIKGQPIKDKLIEDREKLLFMGAVIGQDLTEEERIGAKIILSEICKDLENIINYSAY